jgi:hypothetical protein
MKKTMFIAIVALISFFSSAHPMPHSVILFDVRKDGIRAELSLPLKEFQMVYPDIDIDKDYKTLIERRGKWLDEYLLDHLTIEDGNGRAWKVRVDSKRVTEDEQMLTGKYHELTYDLWMQPPAGSSPRNFTMNYDVIMHQLVTHKLFLKVSSDWYGGMTEKDSVNADLGVLMVDHSIGKAPPVEINLEKKAGTWRGFAVFVDLGMEHITTGTDHLLFLVVLMLSTALTAQNGKWVRGTGARKSLIRIIKVVTAFTIGHSLSLILGTLNWIVLSSKPVEIAIALTILLTAIHVIKPLFAKREGYAAIVFGLIHGLGFSGALAELNLDGERMAYSILGFNIGIELIQLFVLICIVPWLMLMSRYPLYRYVRIVFGLFAFVASIGWVTERVAEEPNILSEYTEIVLSNGKWLLAGIVSLALGNEIYQKLSARKSGSRA